jgi:hypothetical protein
MWANPRFKNAEDVWVASALSFIYAKLKLERTFDAKTHNEIFLEMKRDLTEFIIERVEVKKAALGEDSQR